ncbi:MAG: biotin--[acetyl-CoA-carboxylase] ligase [Clostridiales bacterium]|nr:biotin--[acetyl-CoA-carboxylase] ligase [Candidatus Cacconaster stercorequi]
MKDHENFAVLREKLSPRRDNLYLMESVDSTNSYARHLARQGAPDGTVVLADSQSGGRGRLGRDFQSPMGKGLYLSVLWRPNCTPEQLFSLTALAAVAVCRAVERVTGSRPGIKWPNDLVARKKKVGGILTEMEPIPGENRVDYVVLGIGLNVYPAPFDGEVADMAASLSEQLETELSRAELAAALLEELDTLRETVLWQPTLWLEEYRASCLNLGRTVKLLQNGQQTMAVAMNVDEQYGLMVRMIDGSHVMVRSGEVSVRGLYGYV